MRNRKATTADFLIAGFLFLLILAVVVPFINTIAISFSTQREYLNTPLLLIPREPTLNNYINLLGDKRISIGYLTSLKILLLGLPINLFLTVSLAYGTSRKSYPGKRLILGAILFTMLFNGGILPLYLQMRELHLTNTIWSVILASGINVFYFVLARNYFCSLPEALIESAQLDGAGEWKILFSIILPISKPILATLTLFYIWINSGDMPDVANAEFEFGELSNYANQEAIYRLPDDWKERWPNVAKTQENVPAAAMAEEQLGGTYFLYRPVFSLNRPSERLSYHALIYLRKDWMEACGLELKDTYTPDELKEIAKTFLEKDPGNVGDNLVGMSIRPYDMVKMYPATTFSEACNIGDGYYKDENGQFQWAPADTRTLDALKKYQELYQEGILDPEFYSYTRYQGAQKFYVQGTSGLTLEDGHAIMITYIRNGLAEQGLDPDKVLHLAQLVGDDGMYHYREDSNYWGQVMFSPTISQEKFERAMDILDYTCTKEGQNFMNMGFEGIDWKLDENGNYVSLLDPSIQGSATSVLGGKYPSKESSFGGLILPDDFSLVSPNYNHEIQNTVRNFYKLREELSDETTLLPREYEYEFLSSREKSQATMDLGDEYAKLILKDGKLEDNWNTWVEEKMAVVQPVLDQLNK